MVPNTLNLPYRATKLILEKTKRWVYGYEAPYTIFELEKRCETAGLICIKRGGVTVASSLLYFRHLLPESPGRKTEGKTRGSSLKSRIFMIVESMFDKRLGAFIGENIAVKAIVKGNRDRQVDN